MASAAIGAGASILGGLLGGKGAEKAAKTQAAAYQSGIDEQHRQFDITQQNFQPFLTAGTGALGGVEDLLGLHGNDVQSSAIDALKASPGFTALYDTGADTILQNAAATGGLRGGNTNNSLAQFGSGLLESKINDQLQALGALVNNGLGATSNLGSLGGENSARIGTLLGQQGTSAGVAAAAPYGMFADAFTRLGSYGGQGGFNSFLGGGGSSTSGLQAMLGPSSRTPTPYAALPASAWFNPGS